MYRFPVKRKSSEQNEGSYKKGKLHWKIGSLNRRPLHKHGAAKCSGMENRNKDIDFSKRTVGEYKVTFKRSFLCAKPHNPENKREKIKFFDLFY